MTFAEYNTDDNYDNKNGFNSSMKELVEIGKAEGKTLEEIKASLSPKWKQSKYVTQIDNYYNAPTAPKVNKDETAQDKAIQQKAEATNNAVNDYVKKQTEIKDSDKQHLERTNAIADDTQTTETQKAAEGEEERFEALYNDFVKLGKGYKMIDDKLIENIPTFIWNRYKNGEFGTPGSKDAKSRMAHFVINGFGNSLKVLSNGLMQMGGRSPMFADTTSDWEKFQQTNLAKGMENRWRKYEAETQGAIDLLQKQGMEEQDIRNGIAKLSTNNRLQTAFNMMNEQQKAYLIQVTEEIGDKVGSFDNQKLVIFLIGATISDDKLTWQEAAEIALAKFGKDITAGKYNNAVNTFKEAVGGNNVQTAGYAGGNNLKDYTTIDGETLNFSMIESKDGKDRLKQEAQKLSDKYYNGEIDRETFLKYYTPLYEEGLKHIGTKQLDPETLLNKNKVNKLDELGNKVKELNERANTGNVKPSDYEAAYNKLRDEAVKFGATDKELKVFDKKKMTQESILKAADKANKKKK